MCQPDCSSLHTEPAHTRVLEWRGILERLERFVRLCNCIVLELLQRVAMKALGAIQHCIGRAADGEMLHINL